MSGLRRVTEKGLAKVEAFVLGYGDCKHPIPDIQSLAPMCPLSKVAPALGPSPGNRMGEGGKAWCPYLTSGLKFSLLPSCLSLARWLRLPAEAHQAWVP